MKSSKNLLVFAILPLLAAMLSVFAGDNCTSAVISRFVSASGAPILWKNRDTGVRSNKIVLVNECPYRYLALVNFDDSSGRICYAGLNEAGFGIMNTAAYNLPEKPGELKDMEGFIMADALRKCRTVSDFEKLIEANLGRDLGSEANFGVIDADGNAMLFEVHNHGYKKFDPASVPEKYLINTNFSRSGIPDRGAGYLRFKRASELFASLGGRPVQVSDILRRFSRDTGNILIGQPSFEDFSSFPAKPDTWISTRDSIDNFYTSACVVIVGKNPQHPERLPTLWIIPGEPLTAIAVPLWVQSGKIPGIFWKGKKAAIWECSGRLKAIIRPRRKGNMGDYLRINKLDNRGHTGYLPELLKTEALIFNKADAFLKNRHTAAELAQFQRKMADIAVKEIRRAAEQ
ncbi:MAG: hypothetical protein GXO69_09080 [Acidobacteria bacterium]|nr:hypothetical protein [Acidobacteriota bacterium]